MILIETGGTGVLKIVSAGMNKKYINIVVSWLWNEWGSDVNFKYFEAVVNNSLNENDIPSTFIAVLDNIPAGTVSLWRNDLKSRQDLYPWLSGLYVDKRKRNIGIGKKLQEFAVEKVKGYGYQNVYLFTDLCGYYEKTKWDFLSYESTKEGKLVRVYKKDLSV